MKIHRVMLGNYKKYRILAIAGVFMTVFSLCVGWIYVYYDSSFYFKHNWVKQRSKTWFHWVNLCRYYRFHSEEKAASVAKELLEKITQTSSDNHIMTIQSSDLKEAIKLKSPDTSPELLDQWVLTWSTPVLGKDYALTINHPFILIVHTKSTSPTAKRVAHIRIFNIAEAETIIEIWDLKTTNN